MNHLDNLKDEFLSFLRNNKDKRFAISTHSKADIDTLSCAYAVSSVFPNSTVVVPDELNLSATALAEKLGIKFQLIKDVDRKKFDGMIVVDTSAYALLKEAKDWNIVLIIDHHRADGRDMKFENGLFDEKSPSCAEVVFNILPELKDKKIAFALACAVIADGARFKSARKETFETLAKLMDIAGVDYPELLGFAEPEVGLDVKAAVMKACQRLQYVVIGNYVVVTSEVSSSESDSAAFLSEVADVAFIGSFKEKDHEVRISARARKHVSVPLNEVMKSVAVSFGGNGGGHAKAAGAAIPKSGKYIEVQDILKRCVEEFQNRLS